MFEFDNNVAVKVCGVTNVDDALASAEAGAEMIGLNFSPQSPRCVSAASAGAIIAATRGIRFVGVFENQEREFVQSLAKDLALDAVQLHGDEPPEFVRNLRAPFIIKAFRVGPKFLPERTLDYDCDAILLDTWSATASGGTGRTFSWPVATSVRPFVRPLFLAGGLTSDNVAAAITFVRPSAVDVCSGVESAPGRKDHAEIRGFIEAVRATNKISV